MSGLKYRLESTHFLSNPHVLNSFPSQNEISRILNPSYSPQSWFIDHSQMAYVDTHGLLHDPDYRDFPTLIPRTSKRPHPHSSCATTIPRHSHLAAAYPVSCPPWDRSYYLKNTLSDLNDVFPASDDESDGYRSCDSRSCCSQSRRSSPHFPRDNLHHLFYQYHLRDHHLNYMPTDVHSSPTHFAQHGILRRLGPQ